MRLCPPIQSSQVPAFLIAEYAFPTVLSDDPCVDIDSFTDSRNEMQTSSTVDRIKYRTTLTVAFWPSRKTRATACSSTVGFHCGSSMYTKLAMVRFKLAVRIESASQGSRLVESGVASCLTRLLPYRSS